MPYRPIPRCLYCSLFGVSVALATLGITCAAQVMQPPGTMPGRKFPIPAAPTPAQTSAPANPAAQQSAKPQTTTPSRKLPPSLLDQPPQPARVLLSDGQLTVEAHNSSLADILHQISLSSSMSVEGVAHDQRIFGSYGPGNPRDILSSLLEDAGYNVLMLGVSPDGAPSHLILTARSNAPLPSPQQVAATEPDDSEDDNPENRFAPPPFNPPPRPPAAPVNQQNPNGAIKSPAQILQELEQMRREQQQQ